MMMCDVMPTINEDKVSRSEAYGSDGEEDQVRWKSVN